MLLVLVGNLTEHQRSGGPTQQHVLSYFQKSQRFAAWNNCVCRLHAAMYLQGAMAAMCRLVLLVLPLLCCKWHVSTACDTSRNERGKRKKLSVQRREERGTYGLGMQGTYRDAGDKLTAGPKRVPCPEPNPKQPRPKHSCKMLLPKSAGLARIPQQNGKSKESSEHQ